MKTKYTTRALFSGFLAAALIGAGVGTAGAQTSQITSTGTIGQVSVSGMPALPFLASDDLSFGSRGSSVANLQGFLSELGFLNIPRGVAPGYFGTLTQGALVSYQSSLGLIPTGRLDSATRIAIANSLSGRYPGIAALYGTPGVASGSGTTASSQGGSNQTSSITGMGYWYNNAWYPVTSAPRGGYYSSNPVTQASVAQGPVSGSWYDGVWYPTNIANVGGNESSDRDISNQTRTDANISSTQTSNVQNTNQMANTGGGYWSGNTWYGNDGSITTWYVDPPNRSNTSTDSSSNISR